MAGRQRENDGASPAKIFIGGLPKETREDEFRDHFGKYGKIIDAVIMKERHTNKPRGFGFITYDDASVVETVIDQTHTFHGKQVEIKRTIPKGASQLKDFKTKKLFVGGLPTDLKEDELKEFFSKFGKITNHEIIRDHQTSRSRGFGFVIFDSEKAVDEFLAKKGNKIDLNGTEVEIKKAEPKKPSSSSKIPKPHSFDFQTRPYKDSFDRYGSSYSDFDRYGNLGPLRSSPPNRYGNYGPLRSSPPSRYGGFRPNTSTGFGASGFGNSGFGGPNLGGEMYDRADYYASRYGSYGGTEFGRYGGENLGFGTGSSFGGGESYLSSSNSSQFGGGYGSGFYRGGGGPSGTGTGTGSSRYHPYGR
ncbi:hypothetical protein LUZ60_008697 [Juncus effusus]|nr:hypothetical protein LUZ60_008697 [Juncus effusus]